MTEASQAAQPQPADESSKENQTKIDPVTQIQDSIDSLSLSLFEALRGVRDATTGAPSSNDGGGSGNEANAITQADEPDYDDFLVAYHNQEPHAVAVVKQTGGKPPQNNEEYQRAIARMEFLSDHELTTRLAGDIMAKSHEIDELLEKLPGMDRNKDAQMKYIEKLMAENKVVDRQLEAKHKEAERARDEARHVLQQATCTALGIEEE